MGGFSGYQIANNKGYNFNDWQTYGYIVGGAAIGATMGYFGGMISGAGGVMSQTMSSIFTSTSSSVNMSVLSGGDLAPYSSIGAASVTYDHGSFTVNYPFKKGNNAMTDVGFVFGSMSFIQDCFAADEGTSINVRSRKELAGHSEINGEWTDDNGNTNEILISVGPKNKSALKKGDIYRINNNNDGLKWEWQFVKNAPLARNVSLISFDPKIDDPFVRPINNVNGKMLGSMTSNLNNGNTLGGKGVFRYGLLRGCVNYTSRALFYSGVINVNALLPVTAPVLLNGEFWIRQMGIYASPYLTK